MKVSPGSSFSQPLLFVVLSFLWRCVTGVGDCVRIFFSDDGHSSPASTSVCFVTLYSHPPSSPDCTALTPPHSVTPFALPNTPTKYWWPIPHYHLPQLEKTLDRICKDWSTYPSNKHTHYRGVTRRLTRMVAQCCSSWSDHTPLVFVCIWNGF